MSFVKIWSRRVAATLTVALGVLRTATGAVIITNGGFESVQGPNSTPVSGIELANGWVAENMATVGGIQNATWTVGEENVNASQVTGNRWARVVGDVGEDGGLNQAIGSMRDGQCIVITGDYFTGGNPGPVISYAPLIELYDGDPLTTGSVLATAILQGGALDGATNNTSKFVLSYTAVGDQSSLYLRLRTNSSAPADNGGGIVVTRGGIDNIQVVPEPGTWLLGGLGAIGLIACRRRR